MAAAKDASSVADVAALVFAGGAGSLRAAAAETAAARAAADAWTCVEIKQCVGCARQFFTKSFLGSDLTLATKLIIIIQNQVNAFQNCRFPFYTTGRIQAWRLE